MHADNKDIENYYVWKMQINNVIWQKILCIINYDSLVMLVIIFSVLQNWLLKKQEILDVSEIE